MVPQRRLAMRTRLPLFWLTALALLAVLLPNRVWTTLLVGTAGLVLVAFIWARALQRGLHASRRLRYGWVSVGDRLSEQFELANRARLPAFWVEIRDESNVPGYRVGVVRSASSGQALQWRQSAVSERRGHFQLGPWQLTSADPFGLFRVEIRYPLSEEIIIHPPMHTRLPVPLPAGRSSGRARSRERHFQATVNASSVRDYTPGDPDRWIHWPTSARRDALFVREFDLDAAGDIWVVLDLEAGVQLGTGRKGTEENLVLVAAALAGQGLRQSRSVGLGAYGAQPHVLAPQAGQGQQWQLMRALALVNADGETPLERALLDVGTVARRGSAVVVVTPRADAGWLPALLQLGRRGIQCHAVLLDRVSFGGSGNSLALRDTLWQAGFNAHVLRQGDIEQPREEGERRGFWEFKTTPSGKVIVVRRPDHAEAG